MSESPWGRRGIDGELPAGRRGRVAGAAGRGRLLGGMVAAPCRRLAPMLEALAVEKDGGFLLAKINTDENPDLAQSFQVEGIPAVYAVRDGKMVNSFTGVLPEADLRRFIDDLGGPSEPAEPTPLETALALEGRDPPAAVTAYRAMLADAPDDPAARSGVGPRSARRPRPGSGRRPACLRASSSATSRTKAKRLTTLIELRATPHADADLAAANSAAGAEGKVTLAKVLAARGDYAAAFDSLLAAAEDDQQLGRTAVREFMLKLFEVIGPRSEQADDYRRRFASTVVLTIHRRL